MHLQISSAKLHLARGDQTAILAGQAHGAATMTIDKRHYLLVHLTTQHHFHHVHGFVIGNAHALDKAALLADLLKQFADLRAATMHDDGIDADLFQQHDVLRKAALQGFVHHRVAAKLDDHGFSIEGLDIGQRLDQDFGDTTLVYDAHRVSGLLVSAPV